MIDRFADRGECDFHAEFAVPLPCTVFLQLLGLPLEDLDKFLVWKDGVIRPEGDSGFDRPPRELRRLRPSRSTSTSSAPSTTTSPTRATMCCPR